MPATTAPYVVRLTMRGTIVDQEFLNVFYYAADSVVDTVSAFVDAWITIMSPAWQGLISSAARWDAVDFQGVRGTSAFSSIPVGVSGGVSGDCLPPYCSFDFTLLRDGAGERNGYKRFAGVPESEQQNGLITSAALTAAQNLAETMRLPIDPGTDLWTQVIRRTRVHHVAQIPPAYYTLSTIQYSKIGTQNSRKFGHGR